MHKSCSVIRVNMENLTRFALNISISNHLQTSLFVVQVFSIDIILVNDGNGIFQ
jgi:hypothetical protein